MFNSIFSILKSKKKAIAEDISDDIAGFIPAFDNIQDFKSQHNLTCPTRTTGELIRYLESRPNQKWYVFKSARKKAHPINVGIYEEFPALDDALEWLETYGGGKYFVKPLSLGKCKLGYYEFEGEDKEPAEEEGSVRTKKLRLKYKPRDFREALLLQRLEEGDEQLIQKITDAELSRQWIMREKHRFRQPRSYHMNFTMTVDGIYLITLCGIIKDIFFFQVNFFNRCCFSCLH